MEQEEDEDDAATTATESSAVDEAKKRRSGKEGITVYLRIRPTQRPSKFYNIANGESGSAQALHWDIPPEAIPGSEFVNNTRTKFSFKFNKILPMDITQAQVFERVGSHVVKNALDGFNSTIFAYGQTGSGKTFTMTGGAERYDDRGIIPRALSMIFREFRTRSDAAWTAHISYMEIYNEQGFDLLDPSHDFKGLQDLPRVRMMEDEHGNFHLKNLSMHRATTEEEALNLLFLGDTNRAISETAMNQASSRSHCLFTVFLEARKVGSDRVIRSKLHMVDLAGSERVHKTKSDGQTLREAQYINTSLFYLEMVIVALSERGRSHIPYRNSMMTSVLRDSLGGNCKTVMVATVSAEREQTDESISTCRFAQRVALVKNDATINEETDPAVAISRLKSQVATLKAEVAFLKGETGEGDSLTDAERAELVSACETYVASRDPRDNLQVAPLTLVRIRDCFAILKNMVLVATTGVDSQRKNGSAAAAQADDVSALRKALKEKENEIAILVNMVRQAKGSSSLPSLTAVPSSSSDDKRATSSDAAKPEVMRSSSTPSSRPISEVAGVSCAVADKAVRDDPQRAYSYFRERSTTNAALEENKVLLKEKYGQAKALGQRVDQSRQTIAYLKKTIEQLRRERAIEGIRDASGGGTLEDVPPSAEEAKKKEAIEAEKVLYKNNFEELRTLKTDIETIQRMLEVGRARLQSDFDTWYDQVLKQQPREQAKSTSSDHKATTISETRTAWSTPPYAAQPKKQQQEPAIPLTGNEQTDDDIRAFYRAKEELSRLSRKDTGRLR
ncbi:hypothetical protein CTAYLR_010413 [Chrysophaeum taylorii]|uniref:Kinesin-like protein n=1 Tax=Chrysophaeum taylorii TaxID=2483200 RepID=A0AAD7XMT4_9STRA|nr:hypothetical protein CTAYLR_010413 [Chrysophaeum taylorii]